MNKLAFLVMQYLTLMEGKDLSRLAIMQTSFFLVEKTDPKLPLLKLVYFLKGNVMKYLQHRGHSFVTFCHKSSLDFKQLTKSSLFP